MQTRFDQRENNFDFIRLSLAILVIFSHSYVLGTASEATEPFNRLTRSQVTGGGIAVDLFFVISGFLITASYERSSSVASYLQKRVLRIYPGFIIAMLVELVAVLPASGGHLVSSSPVSSAAFFLAQTLRLREFHYAGAFLRTPYPGPMNGSTWSIQYEFWCYLGVILLGGLGILRSRKTLLIFFAVTIALSYCFLIAHRTPTVPRFEEIFGFVENWARLLPLYIAGIVFYRLRDRLSMGAGWIIAACVSLVVAAIVPFGWSLIFPIAGTYLILVFAFHPAIRLRGISRFGDLSYGTYLYGFPVQQVVMRFIGHAIAPWKLFIFATPLTLICAAASWRLVERRFLQRARRPIAPAEA